MRTPNSDMDTGLRKGKWSHEEDQMLIAYISRYGIWNWSQMPRFAGLSRSGKSCRLRWMNYLKPNIKRGNFSNEEDEIILHSHSVLGNKWSAIASKLPGRTDSEVKNYWHAHLKKRVSRYNKNPETHEQNGESEFGCNNMDEMEQPVNHLNKVLESCLTYEDDSFPSSTSTITSKDQEVDFRYDYYDTSSPGTIDDLQSFWQQLSPFENLELGNTHLNMFSNDFF
ncbi:putative transcription factor MYB-HB-like family [Helianthus annuus]|uniref:Putative homeodomain-like protein n=1 Tax=Helianthus annuus TaxID=4232 RepID=A0A251VPB8_HELAN|nr:transcription factor MYB53 [Helianthus annuus]KAF5821825.1 putative transcription factor MYB family [Helianthus annuus]KAJ0611436.1 putative transcription factor MYB-HB-like family [Helianthus annuus]KAJ0622482.1 putative transcription factor MYB-HB-like family [Helianthus annuus]KAJ0626732.1 putative transcription factor MYB-HB-like family [Helianthus annuus]KAJ0783081.1 putative transcription factor MYB-HB-like family [Helianthus annuus]